jgi:hypothetical protein
MANFIYGKAKEALFNGGFDISSNTFGILLIDTASYTAEQNIHEFVSDIPEFAIKKNYYPVQNITNNLGTIDANDVYIDDYSGQSFDAIVFYQLAQNVNNSRLLFYIDNSPGLPFPGASSVSPVTIIWNNDQNKIISL